jgi:hypothetical protein
VIGRQGRVPCKPIKQSTTQGSTFFFRCTRDIDDPLRTVFCEGVDRNGRPIPTLGPRHLLYNLIR